MRAAVLVGLAALALAPAPRAGAEAAATSPAPSAPAPSAPAPASAAPARPAPVSPLVAASRAAKARSTAPASGKVWTLDDLEALKREHRGGVNVAETSALGTIAVTSVPAAAPDGVQARYREMAAQADAEIAKLERERLAAANPLLRGLGPEKLRSDAEIDAEMKKWKDRRDLAIRSGGGPAPGSD